MMWLKKFTVIFWITFFFFEKIFGEKTKKKWYFSDFGCAAKEYISDLKWAADYMSRDITENAERFIKNQNTAFVKEIKKCFGEKISELEKLVL